jgi:MoaA/NifB/PqqE/SkfB family radical SAM enzyme
MATIQSINKDSKQPFGHFLWHWLRGIVYKRHSFFHQLTPAKAINLSRTFFAYVTRQDKANYYPPVVKVDLSPLCNLHCPICVHAAPKENSVLLAEQEFDSSQMMGVEPFKKIIDEVKGKTQAVYLYLMGEPFMHPHICEMSRYANDAGLNVLVSSHFSFKFPDKKIAEIANSGITHLELSIDGATQPVYEVTRVGGKLDLVLDNLERLCRYKKQHNLAYPKIEVQCLGFEHNRHEIPALRKKVEALGIDMFTTEEGDVGSWAEMAADNFNILGPKEDKPIPACNWPYAAMVIKYNGDAVPCCLFNMGKEFSKDTSKSMALGNVFKDGVMGVWNNEAYRTTRRYVSKPSLVNTDKSLEHNFCYGCPQVSRGTFKDVIVSDGTQFNIRINQ